MNGASVQRHQKVLFLFRDAKDGYVRRKTRKEHRPALKSCLYGGHWKGDIPAHLVSYFPVYRQSRISVTCVLL